MSVTDQRGWIRPDLEQAESLFPRIWASGAVHDYFLTATLGARPERTKMMTHSVLGVQRGLPELRSDLGSRGTTECRLAALEVPEKAWVLVMHDGEESTSREPVGYTAFTPDLTTAGQRVVALELNIHLAWIQPDLRGQGWGVHLMGNLASYLHDNGPPAPIRRSERGEPTEVTLLMPTPERRAERLLRYLAHAFKPRVFPHWNARSVRIGRT